MRIERPRRKANSKNSHGGKPTTHRILEDFRVGQTFDSAELSIRYGKDRNECAEACRRLMLRGCLDRQEVKIEGKRGANIQYRYRVIDSDAVAPSGGEMFIDDETRAYLDTLRHMVGVR